MSVREILYPRCILVHKIGGFRASEGLSKKHECLSQEYFIMQIMDIKIKKLLLTLQKQTIGCMQSKKIVCFPSKINERKKKGIGAEPINIYTTHKIEREFYYRNFPSGFFPLKRRIKHELKPKKRRNPTLLLFSSLWSSVYIHRKKLHGVPLTKDPDVDKYWTQNW